MRTDIMPLWDAGNAFGKIGWIQRGVKRRDAVQRRKRAVVEVAGERSYRRDIMTPTGDEYGEPAAARITDQMNSLCASRLFDRVDGRVGRGDDGFGEASFSPIEESAFGVTFRWRVLARARDPGHVGCGVERREF